MAYRAFQLTRNPTSAARLLRLIPSNESEQLAITTLGDSLCDAESLTDVQKLAAVRDGLPSELTEAVVLAPSFLYRYIRYSIVACRDPHTDFAVRMQRVCEHNRSRFAAISKQLPEAERQQFRAHVFEVETCRALAVPEDDH